MLRTVVSFEPADKAWLDNQAKSACVPMTEIVREAVHYYRKIVEERAQPNMLQLLQNTAGIWKHGDALVYQKKLRAEWDQ